MGRHKESTRKAHCGNMRARANRANSRRQNFRLENRTQFTRAAHARPGATFMNPKIFIVYNSSVAEKKLSQKTIVEVTRVFNTFTNRTINYGEMLYERDFPDWFIAQAEQRHGWNWPSILLDLRRGTFFYVRTGIGFVDSIITGHEHTLSEDQASLLGEGFIRKLAAFATTLPGGESLLRSLQLDGFEVNKEKLRLVALEGPVRAAEEEDRLTRLVKTSGIPDSAIILKHIADAQSLYSQGNDHPSLNESRSLIQALIDGISTETAAHGKHSTKLPGGTSLRIEF